jgi:hypothetical protein
VHVPTVATLVAVLLAGTVVAVVAVLGAAVVVGGTVVVVDGTCVAAGGRVTGWDVEGATPRGGLVVADAATW